MTEDQRLLREYVSLGSRPALEKLIERHLSLVYSSALRQVNDRHLAEDVTQAVFLTLAVKANTIRSGIAIGGWLLAVSRCTAVDAMRKRAMQTKHEQRAARPEADFGAADEWAQIAPLLDGALASLPAIDRSAVVLRFFQNLSLAETGTELGISEDAARKRVARALERLRKTLSKRGAVVAVAALGSTLAARAVEAAPKHLLAGALLSARGPSEHCLTMAKGAMNMLAWTKMKLIAAMAVVLVLSGAGVIAVTSALGQTDVPAQPGASAPPPAAAPIAAADQSPAVKIVSYEMRTTFGGQPDMVTQVIESDAGFTCRSLGDGKRSITDEHTLETVQFDDQKKTVAITPGPVDPAKYQPKKNGFQRYADMAQQGRDVGPDVFEGHAAEKFVFNQPGAKLANGAAFATTYTIWLDSKSHEVIHVADAVTDKTPGGRGMGGSVSKFEVNPKLPANMLSVDPPPGYTFVTPPRTPDVWTYFSGHIGEIAVEVLRAAPGDKAFPADLGQVGGIVEMKGKDIPTRGPFGKRQWFVRINLAPFMADYKLNWGYPGAGKARGNPDELIFWWKTAEGFTGIFGDMAVKPLSEEPVEGAGK